MVEESFVYLLCEDGKLHARWLPSFHQATDESLWQWVTDLGTEHTCVIFDCGYLYGVNAYKGVDFQGFKGACEDRWTTLSRGSVVDIAGYGGEIYGLGAASGGDRVYRMTRAVDKHNKNPWERVSKGSSRAIAIEGDELYGLGNNNWVYQQSMCGLTAESTFVKAFELDSSASSLAVVAGGQAFAVISGNLYYRDPGYGSWNRVLGPGVVIAVFVGPEIPNVKISRFLREHVESDCSADCQASSGEDDLSKLSVKQLKASIADLGATVPIGITEKSELVAVLRDAMSAETRSTANVVDEGVGFSRDVEISVGSVIVASTDVSASGEGYLTLRVGDEIEVLHRGDSTVDSERGWLYGKSLASGEMGWLSPEHAKISSLEGSANKQELASGEMGWLLVDHAKISSLERSVDKQEVALGLAKVHEPVMSTGPGYIALQAGATVMVEHIGSPDSDESGWLFGHDLASGCRGWFPAKAVQELT